MQTRSNSHPIKDPASGQALGDDNGSAKSSSRETISEAPQGPARGDAPLVGEGVRLPSDQEASENPGAMGARNPMEVDTLPGNEESGRENENEIAAEIERLKKGAKEGSNKNQAALFERAQGLRVCQRRS